MKNNKDFDNLLQTFSTQVGFIVGLESNKKIGAEEAYRRIKKMWKEIKDFKKQND